MKALFLFLLAFSAQAQVTDPPILTMPPADAVYDIRLKEGMGCVAWWEKDTDPYGDYHLVRAALDVKQLPAVGLIQNALNTRDIPALVKARTVDAAALDAVYEPCKQKLSAPPLRWIVAPTTTGKRPAFPLKADGTRGAQQGTADTTISGKPMWCNCHVRSIETTSSTYCAWATAASLVTLCREVK